jgi:hypothetical protein
LSEIALGTKAATASQKVLSSVVFQSAVALLCVFLLSLIILVAIRPPFTYVKPAQNSKKERYRAESFSAGVAALYALGATVLAGVAMAVTYAVIKKTKPVN